MSAELSGRDGDQVALQNQQTPAHERWPGLANRVYSPALGRDFVSPHFSKERPMGSISKEGPMGSKQTSRRELLKSSGALAGGLALGAIAPALGETLSGEASTHDHAMASGSENAYPMIPSNK